ncbi:DUF418 domain-containing protein [Nocardioides aurantiacus]|uniref:Putative membrane protein YeiB n=1 Tax=Nocardioides aurantiacus TaxID=86796 RepID=A0A3N2CVL3_9ACTN|nr:DUF418 domain-containing protein [Nocardioides aurantiacus]ROR91529.1 putative membrane protein YeiB [Nocardioides aurantiacus]
MATAGAGAPAVTGGRLVGPDVVRAVALVGVVVMNYYGYLVLAGSPREPGTPGEVFDPATGPLATRFAATFVLVAGVGATLMTRSAEGAELRRRRVVLLRRGLALFVVGWLVDLAWEGTILPYYGAMFAVAALLVVLSSRGLVVVGALAALAAAGLSSWSLERRLDGGSVVWLTDPPHWTPQGLLLDTVVNGTHPLLPWLAFFCAGVLLGRALSRPGWRPTTVGLGLVLLGGATAVSKLAATGSLRLELATSAVPSTRSLVYTAGALGSALLAFALVSWLAERAPRSPVVDVLRRAGAMSLTIYLAHIVVFRLLVDGLGVVPLTGLAPALLLAAGFWLVAVVAAWWWHRRFGIGPAEAAYRWIGG